MESILSRARRPARTYRCSNDSHASRQGIVYRYRLAKQGLLWKDNQFPLQVTILPNEEMAEEISCF